MPAKFVYVISGDHGRQKVGVTDDPKRRIAQLQTGSPFPLKFEFLGMADGDAYKVEVEAHFLLNRHKAAGGDEWFTVPPEVAITAVMAGARQCGLTVKPVDPDNIPDVEAEVGSSPESMAPTIIAGVPFLLLIGWLVFSFDRGKISAIAAIVCAVILGVLFKLVRRFLITIGQQLGRLDRAMHDGPKVPLSLD